MFDLSLINYMNKNGLMNPNGTVEDFLRKYLKIAYSNDSGDSWNKQLKKLRLSDTNGTPKTMSTIFKYKDLGGFTGIKQEGKKLGKRLNKVLLEADGVNRNPCSNPYWELPGRKKLTVSQFTGHENGIHIGALPRLTDTMKKKICDLTGGKIEGDYLILDNTSINDSVTNILNNAGHQGHKVRYIESRCETKIDDETFKLPDEITVRDTDSPGYQFSVDGKFISELNHDQKMELCVLTKGGLPKNETTLSLDLAVAEQFVDALKRAGHSKRAFKVGGVKVAGCKGDYEHMAEAAQEFIMDVICL